MDFFGFFPWKKGGENPPQNPRQNSNQNFGASRPKSTARICTIKKNQEPNGNCSDTTCSDAFFILGGFFSDGFPPVILSRILLINIYEHRTHPYYRQLASISALVGGGPWWTWKHPPRKELQEVGGSRALSGVIDLTSTIRWLKTTPSILTSNLDVDTVKVRPQMEEP